MPKISVLVFGCVAAVWFCVCSGCTSAGVKEWSIGMREGEDPFKLSAAGATDGPVLTAAEVTDVSAEFVADPFMVRQDGKWYMFFEVLPARTRQGDIGLATSEDGLHWRYQCIVLDEPFHLSYPCVFKCDDEYYMVPESHEAGEIRLYRAERFPDKWAFASTLLKGGYLDPTVFHFNGRWWMFASVGNTDLHLFYADRPTGPWTRHPRSPVVKGNSDIARPGGRVVTVAGRPVRYTQDDFPTYGSQVRAFEVVRLTTDDYEEREVHSNPVLKGSGHGWNAGGMHHIDAHELSGGRWLACVDGWRVNARRPPGSSP